MGIGATLDGFGRSMLRLADPRALALLALFILCVFLIFRRKRYGSLPSNSECLRVVFGLLTLFSAIIVGVVFVLTDPPAIEVLSPGTLPFYGLVILIAVIGQVIPELLDLFKPEAKEPPEEP